jgi:hypothetical protein
VTRPATLPQDALRCPQDDAGAPARPSHPSATPEAAAPKDARQWAGSVREVAEVACPFFAAGRCEGYGTRCRVLGKRPLTPCEWVLERGLRHVGDDAVEGYRAMLGPAPPGNDGSLLRQLAEYGKPPPQEVVRPQPVADWAPWQTGRLLSGRPCPGCEAALPRGRRLCDACGRKARRATKRQAQRRWRRKRATPMVGV